MFTDFQVPTTVPIIIFIINLIKKGKVLCGIVKHNNQLFSQTSFLDYSL